MTTRVARLLAAVAMVGLGSRPTDACEPVKTPFRADEAAVLLVAATRTTGAGITATVAAGRSNGRDLTSGEYVLVPWAYGPDCRPLAWNAGRPAPWSPPAGPAVYSGQLRPRDRWIGERPTLDVYMAARQPLWTEGGSSPEFPGGTPLLTAREFFDFYLSLPTVREFDQRVPAARDQVDRWASEQASLASREPARSMLDSLRWLWTHGRLPAEQPLSFSNVRSTGGDDPHAYGIVIEIFKHDGMWTGFISEYVGPVADPPAARLDDLRVDEGSGRITFTAALTIGVTLPPDTKAWVPSRRRYEFTGTIGPDTVAGLLVKRPADNPSASPTREDVVLNREPGKGSDLPFDAWVAIWRVRLSVRGPME